MKLKTLIVCVVILAVASAAVFIAQRPGRPPSEDPRIGNAIVDRSAVEKAAALRVSDQGKTITLKRNPDGTWRDASYYDLPADFSKLSSFVGSLTDAKIDRLVTSNLERIARLEFKDTKIELLDSADKPVWAVTLGKSADSGGRFLRYDDESKAYLATVNAWIDNDAKAWANAELLNLKPDDIAKIEIGFAATAGATPAPVTLTREKKDSAWTTTATPAGKKLKPDTVSSVLTSVGTIRFTDTNDLKDPNVTAAKANERVFKLTTFDGKTYTVAMGRKPEEKKLKPPAGAPDGKTGPASLGSVTDLAKKEDQAKEPEKKDTEPKPVTPEYETIPAGPVFVFISSSDASAPVNALMQKRAFQVGDYIFTSLPQKPDDLFEAAPAAAPKPAEKKPADAPVAK